MLTEKELINPELSDETISKVLYAGDWKEIQYLKQNPKFKGYNEEVWPDLSNNYEFFMTPWYPLAFVLVGLSLNLIFHIFGGGLTLVLVVGSLIYIYKIIPLMYRLKNYNRIKLLDNLLEGTPYHQDLYKKEDESDEKEESAVVVEIDEDSSVAKKKSFFSFKK